VTAILIAAWVDVNSVFGIASLILLPLTAIASGWAINKTQTAKAYKDGMDVAYTRLDQANKWKDEVEHRNTELEARFEQQQNLIEMLTDRVQVQDKRVSELLKNTPEALARAMVEHTTAAQAHWEFEREMLAKIDHIIERMARIEDGVN
jgi:predicted  nucleic acid-binding Zn-ribbon protein